GSNMVALADAVGEKRIAHAEIAIVISDQPEAAGLKLAQDRGLATLVVERSGRSRLEHDREIVAVLQHHRVDLVCLAGYMRLISPTFVETFRNRLLDSQLSLLPSLPGLVAQQQALSHGVKWTGCEVHFVDETLDGGPIIAQQVVPVLEDDSVETLTARILTEEHRLYPRAVHLVLNGAY